MNKVTQMIALVGLQIEKKSNLLPFVVANIVKRIFTDNHRQLIVRILRFQPAHKIDCPVL